MVASMGALGVVVGVDGSSSSDSAVIWAAREAASRGMPLTLAHVQPRTLESMLPQLLASAEAGAFERTRGEGIVQRAYEIVVETIGRDVGIAVDREVLVGPVVPALADLSKGAEMVVAGCRGEGPVDRLLLGSVSSGLLHHARCPVAVIHDDVPAAANRSRAPILVGIDGSPASEAATAIAFDMASRRGVRLQALHVWSGWTDFELPGYDVKTAATQEQMALAERLAGWQERYPDVPVDRIVMCGHPAEAILSHSKSAQLVVLGSHGRGGFAGMLLGSVSTAVASSATIPVIVARCE